MKAGAVIRFLQAVYYGPGLDGHLTGIGPDKGVGSNPYRLHGKVQLHLIPTLPPALDYGITVCHDFGNIYLLAIDEYPGITAPFGNPKGQTKFLRAIQIHADPNFSIPWIVGGLCDTYFLSFNSHIRPAGYIKMGIDCIVLDIIDVMVYGSQESCNVRRTAGTCKPFLTNRFYMFKTGIVFAGFRVNFQGIDIEK